MNEHILHTYYMVFLCSSNFNMIEKLKRQTKTLQEFIIMFLVVKYILRICLLHFLFRSISWFSAKCFILCCALFNKWLWCNLTKKKKKTISFCLSTNKKGKYITNAIAEENTPLNDSCSANDPCNIFNLRLIVISNIGTKNTIFNSSEFVNNN